MQIKNANAPIQVTGRHVSVTEAMKEYCRRKVASLHLDYPKIIEVQVILDVQKYRHLAEVILHCSNHITLEASATSSDMYASMDQVLDRIGRQMRKYKTRLLRRHRPRKEDIRHLEEQVLHPEPVEEDEHHEHTGRQRHRAGVADRGVHSPYRPTTTTARLHKLPGCQSGRRARP